MGSKSQVRDPAKYTMGDDFCDYLTKVGVPKKKAPPNKKYPEGIRVSEKLSTRRSLQKLMDFFGSDSDTETIPNCPYVSVRCPGPRSYDVNY